MDKWPHFTLKTAKKVSPKRLYVPSTLHNATSYKTEELSDSVDASEWIRHLGEQDPIVKFCDKCNEVRPLDQTEQLLKGHEMPLLLGDIL